MMDPQEAKSNSDDDSLQLKPKANDNIITNTIGKEDNQLNRTIFAVATINPKKDSDDATISTGITSNLTDTTTKNNVIFNSKDSMTQNTTGIQKKSNLWKWQADHWIEFGWNS